MEPKYKLEKQMTVLSETLIEIREHNQPDYKPLIDYQSWRVALMNYTADLLPEKINRMQKHTQTDEVFVLMKGRCILFIGEGDESVTKVHAVDMELYKLYNVKKGVWHSHTFSEDARVLIVENRDTVFENSPFVPLLDSQRKEVVELTKNLLK
jgi:mannose-6-phosphate isomerase-like protein (cupin superfamily)